MERMPQLFTRWLARWLGGSDLTDAGDVELTLESTWNIAPWIPLLVLMAAATLVVYLYLFTGVQAPRRWRVMLALLRIGLVALVLWMMFGLSVRRFRTDLPDLVILLDDSASMATVDQWTDSDMSSTWAQFIEHAGTGDMSRYGAVQAYLLRERGQLLRHLDDRYRLKLFRLSSRAPHGANENIEPLLKELRDSTADYGTSALGDRLREIVDGQRGRPTAAIVVFSDGIATQGRPWDDAAQYARSKGMPLYVVGVGNDQPAQDVEIRDLLAEETVYVRDVLDFAFSLTGIGYEGQEVVVRLRREDQPGILAETTVTLGPDRHAIRGNLRHRVEEEGVFQYVVEAVPREDETDSENNARSVRVEVRNQTIRVLLVQNYPSYEFRFLKNTLGRRTTDPQGEAENPVQLHTVLQQADLEYAATDETALRVFPVQRDELFSYDVLILGDVDPSYFSSSVMENIVQFVTQRGGGLILAAGPRFTPIEFAGTPLARLLPVDPVDVQLPAVQAELNSAYRVQPTRLGRTMAWMQLGDDGAEAAGVWQQMPPLYWLAQISDLKPGVMVLAEDPTRSNANGAAVPVVCLQYVGAGKVLSHWTDETYRWRFRRGDAIFARYWHQAVRYLSRGNLGDNPNVELSTDRKEYLRGEPVHLRVRFLDDRLAPVSDDGVTIMLEQEGHRKRRITLERTPTERGIFEGTLFNLTEGHYHGWVVTPALNEGEPTCDFEVTVPLGELARLEAATTEMRQAARLSRGRYYDILQAEDLARDLPEGRHVRIESLTPRPVWNSWKLALLFVGLIGSEWLLRRRVGMA